MTGDRLSGRLRNETRLVHGEVERTGIMPRLLRGEISRGAYCALLRNLHEIYAVLETELMRHSAAPHVAPIFMPALHRQAALAEDLHFLHGEGWAQELPVTDLTVEYATRLQDIGSASPELLAAHSYVRYLGDLSGGQLLKRIVADALHLEKGKGTRFYEFPEPATVLAMRYRTAMDALPLDQAAIERIVIETRHSFRMHADLFSALAAAHPEA